MPGTNLDSYHGEERRKSPRVPVCMAAAAECDAWMSVCHTKDVSDSGAFLIGQNLPTVATGFSVDLLLPGGIGRLRLGAAVVRIQGGEPRGFGVVWKNVGARDREKLKTLWERWSQAFPVRQA